MSSVGRYTRQTSLLSFGVDGQAKLADSQVLIIGLGGLGLPVAQYLNAMGVGTLGLVDNDTIELHNLQRQILYAEADIGKSKLTVTKVKLKAQNSETKIKCFDTFLTPENALTIIKDFDLIIDATDNFATRYLINDACVLLNKPFVYGALHGFEGQVSVFNYQNGPTYRCLFPDIPKKNEIPNCNENGVLGILPGIIGTLQALEAVKVLTGVGEVLSGKLLLFDGLTQTSQKINFRAKEANKDVTSLQKSYGFQNCAINSVTVEVFSGFKNEGETQLIDVRNIDEFENSNLPGAKNIPLKELEFSLTQINFEKPVYLICQSGQRSILALEILLALEPNAKIYHIIGGMNKMTSVCH
ncbi:molybdopterin-synthase adenylyltransferase MoeB [uncultured Croceitalea sp.]|uniref:molybdopterin-synthase adenylyltransferase MoeB n=1 Tax=uncultured Croceitalea sp. TaxID=1798908 RepID=UPI00374E6318